MRLCRIAPPDCAHPGLPCCKDCPDTACQSRCLNSPEWCRCCEEGPSIRRSGRTSRLDRDKLLELNGQGLTLREIAGRLGCGVSTVCANLRKMGVKRYG